MSIRADSFGSTGEVKAVVYSHLGAQTTFNSTTRPTLAEVEKFIDRASGVLNMALRAQGFDPANVRANTTAKLACDDWVIPRAVAYVRLAQPGAIVNDSGNERDMITDMAEQAATFVSVIAGGLKNAGVSVEDATSAGLAFTAIDKRSERDDPDDTSREQPLFRRRKFDNTLANLDDDGDYD